MNEIEFAKEVGADIKRLNSKFDNLPDSSKLGKNLVANSAAGITNALYPITSYYFIKEPVAGQTYTITVKAKLGTGKTGIVAELANGVGSFGALTKVGEGLYSLVVEWKSKKADLPYKTNLYIAPNNKQTSTIEWVKVVEGVDTDYQWYPNYPELVDTYYFTNQFARSLQAGKNQFDDSLTEKIGTSKVMPYKDVTAAIDSFGTGTYTLSLDIKADKAGDMQVYISGSPKYTCVPAIVPVTTEYQRLTIALDMTLANTSAKSSMLTFFGNSNGGIIPTVRRVRFSKGASQDLPWNPSENELSKIYIKMMEEL